MKTYKVTKVWYEDVVYVDADSEYEARQIVIRAESPRKCDYLEVEEEEEDDDDPCDGDCLRCKVQDDCYESNFGG